MKNLYPLVRNIENKIAFKKTFFNKFKYFFLFLISIAINNDLSLFQKVFNNIPFLDNLGGLNTSNNPRYKNILL